MVDLFDEVAADRLMEVRPLNRPMWKLTTLACCTQQRMVLKMQVPRQRWAIHSHHSLLMDTLPSDALLECCSLHPGIDHEVSEFEDLEILPHWLLICATFPRFPEFAYRGKDRTPSNFYRSWTLPVKTCPTFLFQTIQKPQKLRVILIVKESQLQASFFIENAVG